VVFASFRSSNPPPTISDRESGTPAFWNVRYAENDHLFGTGPSAFVDAEADRLSPGSEVLELGAGEARTLLALAQQNEHRGTAVDFSAEALAGAQALAKRAGVDLETIEADVRTWRPGDRRWDAAVVTFLQLLPDERVRLYDLLRTVVRPGGWIFGQWFRPAHLSGTYDRIGPSSEDRMVPRSELEQHFAADALAVCEKRDVHLEEGEFLRGHAACVHLVARRGG
jgi:hypothetical protein